MPSNISHVPSLTGKAILSLENKFYIYDLNKEFYRHEEESLNTTFLRNLNNIDLEDIRQPLPTIKKALIHVTRFTLTFGIIAVVAPLGTVINGIPFTFYIVSLPCRYIYYTSTNQPTERTAARQNDWNQIKTFGDGFFRDLALASTFHLSLLPLAMGYKLGTIYAISLTAYTSFSPDVALKLLAPAKVRAAFMKSIFLRNQFGLLGPYGLLKFDPVIDDETSRENGPIFEKYTSLADEIRALMKDANLDHVKWQGEDVESKIRFLDTIHSNVTLSNVSDEQYRKIKAKVELFWMIRQLLVDCIYCREYSIFHDRREKANVKIPIPDVLTGVKRASSSNTGSSGTGSTGDYSPPPSSSGWLGDVENALKMLRDDDGRPVISEANGLPEYSDPNMKEAYRVFRKGIISKKDFCSLFADMTNPYNKDKLLESKAFYRKMALILHPDKYLEAFTNKKLQLEKIELFKLLSNANERF